MKKLTLSLTAFLFASQLFAQKLEVTVQAGATWFHNTGKSAADESYILQGNNASNYTNNPYGKKYGLGFGGSLQTQLVSKSGFIVGLQTGYERLTSKVNITSTFPNYSFILYDTRYANPYYALYTNTPAHGKTYLKNDFINITPYFGYRVKLKNMSLDILPGADIGLALKTKESGKAINSDGEATEYTTALERPKPPTDIRLRLGINLNYKRYGVTTSYAHGLTNYQSDVIGDASFNSKSELFRLGLSYRIF